MPRKAARELRERRRSVRISLAEHDWIELTMLAHVAEVSPEALAGIWIADAISQRAASRAVRLWVGEARSAVTPTGQAATTAAATAAPRPSALHEEIADVIALAGRPMTVGEIATAIRSRGKYRSPRTG